MTRDNNVQTYRTVLRVQRNRINSIQLIQTTTFLHVPRLNKYVKFVRIVEPINYRISSDATRKQNNMSERKSEKRSVDGLWTDVSFWTRAPGVRIYKAHTEFSMDKRDTEECESSSERLCNCSRRRRAVVSIPRDPDIIAKSSTQLV